VPLPAETIPTVVTSLQPPPTPPPVAPAAIVPAEPEPSIFGDELPGGIARHGEAHPPIPVNSPLDEAMAKVVGTSTDAAGGLNSTSEAQELVHGLSQRPGSPLDVSEHPSDVSPPTSRPRPTTPLFGRELSDPRPPRMLGIAAIFVGLAAVAVCWVPTAMKFAIPLGVCGAMLGIGALVTRNGGRHTRLTLPVAGVFASAIGPLLAIVLVNRWIPLPDRHDPSASAPIRAINALFPSAPAGSPLHWKTAPSARGGDVEVRVVSALVLHPAIDSGKWETIQTFSQRCLRLTLELQNIAPQGRVEYHSWRQAAPEQQAPALTDGAGDPLKMIELVSLVPVGRLSESPSYLDAGRKPKSDVLLFEVPPESGGDLNLSLPGANIGAAGTTLRINIPEEMIRRQ